MNNFIVIVVWLALGGVCSYYAKERGRNPIGWFIIGLVFGLLGLITLFLIPNRKKRRAI